MRVGTRVGVRPSTSRPSAASARRIARMTRSLDLDLASGASAASRKIRSACSGASRRTRSSSWLIQREEELPDSDEVARAVEQRGGGLAAGSKGIVRRLFVGWSDGVEQAPCRLIAELVHDPLTHRGIESMASEQIDQGFGRRRGELVDPLAQHEARRWHPERHRPGDEVLLQHLQPRVRRGLQPRLARRPPLHSIDGALHRLAQLPLE